MLEIQRRRRFRFFIRSLWGQKSFSSFHRSENKKHPITAMERMTPRYPSIFSAPPRKMPARPDRTVAANAAKKICFHPHTLPAHFCNDYTRLGGKRTEAMAEVFQHRECHHPKWGYIQAFSRWQMGRGYGLGKENMVPGGFSYSFCQTSLRAARGNFTVPSHSGQGTRAFFTLS